MLCFNKKEMLRPRTPPLKAKLQASLNSLEPMNSMNLSNPNSNIINENINNSIINLSVNNNLTYIDSSLSETATTIMNNTKETENINTDS
jgi:hypothetical protein